MTILCIKYRYCKPNIDTWLPVLIPLVCVSVLKVPILENGLVLMAPKTKRFRSGASSSSQAQPNLSDTQTIATHLGLQNTGLSEESTTFPNIYPPGTSTSVLDAHDRFLHLMVSWFFRPSGGKWSTIRVKSFSYATVLSHIFLKEHIDCTVDLALPLTDPIDEKSLRKCKFHLVNNEWVWNPNPQDDDGDDIAPPQAPPVVVAPPPVDIQALFAQLNANLDARFTAIDARFTTFTDDVNAQFNSLDARHNAMETRFKAQEDALRRVETEVSAHHLEWSSHTFGGLSLNDHSDEDEEDIPPP
ncbi:hypothetical protein V6N11_022855 [Hibiscus sabdariffa]|uniref:Uncharacterized protein n=1 Tax=Hibiscus sabdariffa TaxID=183260 RepID=A0ABR2TKZ5_9ROSI